MQAPLILHVFPTFGLGGQQRRFAEIVSGLSHRFRHHVVSLSDDVSAKALLPGSAYVEVSTVGLKKTPLTHPSNLNILKSIFQKTKPNILCTYNWGAMEAVIALRFTKVKSIAHYHFEDGFGPDETPDHQKMTRTLARRFLLKNSDVIVPSRTLYDLAVSKWRLPEALVRHIPNGIDTQRFKISNRIYNHTGPVKIGTVGAFRPEKNFKRLIQLFDECDVLPKASLSIVGDGPQLEVITKAARSAKRSLEIDLPGATTTPEKAYADFDIFVLSSDTEQMPLSLIEAMMAGLPVVATDVGDVKEMVSDENKEFICSPEDDIKLIQSFEKLIDDEVLRERLGRANQKKALAQYDRKNMIDAFEHLFVSKI